MKHIVLIIMALMLAVSANFVAAGDMDIGRVEDPQKENEEENNEEEIVIWVDGTELEHDNFPFLLKDDLMIPLGELLTATGVEIVQDEKSFSAILEEVIIQIKEREEGGFEVQLNDETVDIDPSPLKEEGEFFLPLEFLSEAFPYEFTYDETEQVVEVKTPAFVPTVKVTERELEEKPYGLRRWVDMSREETNVQGAVRDEKLYILATFGRKNTGGYEVEIKRIKTVEDSFKITVSFKEPSIDQPTIQVISRPFDLVYVDLSEYDAPEHIIYNINWVKEDKFPPQPEMQLKENR